MPNKEKLPRGDEAHPAQSPTARKKIADASAAKRQLPNGTPRTNLGRHQRVHPREAKRAPKVERKEPKEERKEIRREKVESPRSFRA